jgi:hypothetical protein
LPDLVVLGAAKCGTTSLHHYLDLHPEISMSRTKELHFFVEQIGWGNGVSWYTSQFDGSRRICGETSPSYSQWPVYDGVPERMRRLIPEAKLIYLVRDPVERLISDFRHQSANGLEHRPLREILAARPLEEPYIAAGLYHAQITRYLDQFPASSVLVVSADDLQFDRSRTLTRIFRFLGVDPAFRSARFMWRWNRSATKRRLTPRGAGLRPVLRRLLRALPFEVRGPIERMILVPFSRPCPRPEVSNELRLAACELFRSDTEALRRLTGFELLTWSV